MGMIDCSSEDFEEVTKLFTQWLENYEHHSYINHNTVKIVNNSYENYYGGIKVGFFVDIKHDYYGMVFQSLINAFESLMNTLPFDKAILYHDGSGNLIEWFLTDSDLHKAVQRDGDFIEKTDFPKISRVTRGDYTLLESFELITINR